MMDKIEEQVSELRRFADEYGKSHETLFDYRKNLLLQAADTIESLSAKLQAANGENGNKIVKEIRKKAQELSNQHWGDDERHLIGKGIQCMCVQAENIIKANMERPVGDCDGWIYCGDGKNLPKEKEWYMTTCVVGNGSPFSQELYFDGAKFDTEEIEAEYYYTLCKVLAWQPLPEPYHEP